MLKIATSIRPITVEDTEKLIPLMRTYIVDFYKCPNPTDQQLADHIKLFVGNPILGKQFIIENDGDFVGFATLYFTFSTTKVRKIAILNDLFISDSVRGNGLGEELFNYALNYSKENDYAVMSWKTAQDNTTAQSLYNKVGGLNTNASWINYEIKFN
ncbi:GNAT family N-acetyltransferase [Bacillus sp. ISL-53]|nr:GNAT family N-acetyltransferase [Bacillus sp. ISL-53]